MGRGTRVAVGLAGASLGLVACEGGSDGQSTETGVAVVASTATVIPTEPTATVEAAPTATGTSDPAGAEALAVVQAFDPMNDDAVGGLNEVIFNGGDIVPALAPLLEDEDPTRRWAAVYVVALSTDTPEEIRVLSAALDDSVLELRAAAAGSLSGLGVVDALPVLIEALGSEALLPYSDPPRPLKLLARRALEASTGQSFADTAGWQAWWGEVKETVRWDGEQYVVG